MPTTSKTVANVNTLSSIHMSQRNIRRKETQNLNDISSVVSIDYKQFEDKLMKEEIYNSTFQLDSTDVPGNIVGCCLFENCHVF